MIQVNLCLSLSTCLYMCAETQMQEVHFIDLHLPDTKPLNV